jgi:hypothetical protein
MFTVCLTAYVVFIMMLGGVAEMAAASSRALYTGLGGVLALCAYGLWPTWAGSTARPALAELLEAHSAYVHALLSAYADPEKLDLRRVAQLRADARLARSNAEAVVERMLAEPTSRASIAPRAAIGLLAALRRQALASLSLQAGLERGAPTPVSAIQALNTEMTESLLALARAVRSGAAPGPLPPLRQTQIATAPPHDMLLGQETDLMVDAINTMAELLAGDAERTARA